MQRSKNARTKNKGFTLTEMLVTLIIAGILAAITAPSLVGLLNRNQINEAQRQVESAIKEAQRQSIRRGKKCRVRINTNTKTIFSPDDGCLLSQRKVGETKLGGGDTVSLKAKNPVMTISFNHKGTTNSSAVIVIESSLSSAKKCVAIASRLGAVRSGDYTGNVSVPANLHRNFCSPAD